MSNELDRTFRAIAAGETVMLIDDMSGTGGAFFVTGAATVTAGHICTMANRARGVVLAAVPEARLKELNLPLAGRREPGTPFELTVSVEARHHVTTGISAADRARTLQVLATTRDPKTDLVAPGHIFPVRAKTGGVLVRAAVAEGAVDLVQLAGSASPVAALCHCLDELGGLLDGRAASSLATELGMPAIGLSDIVRHRLSCETIVERIAAARLPLPEATDLRAACFVSKTDNAEHLALYRGITPYAQPGGAPSDEPVLVRVQAEHRLGDLLDLGENPGLHRIRAALREIAAAERGVFVYVRHPRKGILGEQARSLAQDGGHSRAHELREHGIGAQILRELGVRRIVLLTNSTRDITGIEAFQLEIVDRRPFGLP